MMINILVSFAWGAAVLLVVAWWWRRQVALREAADRPGVKEGEP